MTATDLFQPGAMALRRDVHAGRVWTAMAQRVVADTGHVLTLAYRPGVESLAPTTWIASTRTGDQGLRERGLADLAAGTWTLDRCRWTGTTLLSHFLAGEWFSVHCFQDAAGEPLRWYVNFEKPFLRRPGVGIDTLDLCLDLVVTPDLSGHHRKDRQEYAQLRRLGVIDDYLHCQVEQAQGRALTMLDNESGPFAGGRPTWTLDPGPRLAAARTARRRRPRRRPGLAVTAAVPLPVVRWEWRWSRAGQLVG
ncbi:DUF402 domain-containing protein [Streptomyces sp. BE20]|uniref:DUF402 domain-containing protein n=1 Tax=Streptomyces sp. BE20 TaxID=3002525 RepID=UPI002E76EEF0|nr:DUF402 domain-containing protein [Streptomyces sp. BE20]MEE1820795.1 DUF402 domain-containing protein [Streptomyces sp. BE20]